MKVCKHCFFFEEMPRDMCSGYVFPVSEMPEGDIPWCCKSTHPGVITDMSGCDDWGTTVDDMVAELEEE